MPSIITVISRSLLEPEGPASEPSKIWDRGDGTLLLRVSRQPRDGHPNFDARIHSGGPELRAEWSARDATRARRL